MPLLNWTPGLLVSPLRIYPMTAEPPPLVEEERQCSRQPRVRQKKIQKYPEAEKNPSCQPFAMFCPRGWGYSWGGV